MRHETIAKGSFSFTKGTAPSILKGNFSGRYTRAKEFEGERSAAEEYFDHLYEIPPVNPTGPFSINKWKERVSP
jgi:hypothetical protein